MFAEDLEKRGPSNWWTNSWAKHPTTGYYDWVSWEFGKEKWKEWKVRIEDGYFKRWDREAWEERKFYIKDMPKEFVVIAESWNVKWFLKNKGSIWSREIYDFSEPLTIYAKKDGKSEQVWHWLWNEDEANWWIKKSVTASNLKIWRNLHCFDPKSPDEIFTICVKGAASGEWGETFKDLSWLRKKVIISGEKDLSSGGTDYSIPTFKTWADITDSEREQRNKLWKILTDYHNEEAQTTREEVLEEAIKKEYSDEELPF